MCRTIHFRNWLGWCSVEASSSKDKLSNADLIDAKYTYFYRQLDFPSEPGVASEILENEPKSCLVL